jgi:periplasmic protein TonB
MEAVTDVLRQRTRADAGLNRMVAISFGLHVALIAGLLLMPGSLARPSQTENVMQISLGGAPGPRSGGMTPMAGRAVAAPPTEAPDAPPRRVAPAPPAARAPEMTLPAEKAPRVPPQKAPAATPRSPTPPREAPARARGPAAPAGTTPQAGNAVAETGAKGIGFGLTTGGGGVGGQLDVGDFCCPEYLTTMLQLIQRNWNSNQQVAGTAVVRFTVQRDGRLTDVQVTKPSGYFALDQTAQRALLMTRQLPPLPAQFTESQLTVHLIFQYER